MHKRPPSASSAQQGVLISRRTPASVSPGRVRRSSRIVQRSGTMLAWEPPQMAPTLTVAQPSNGWRRRRNCAA